MFLFLLLFCIVGEAKEGEEETVAALNKKLTRAIDCLIGVNEISILLI
jgi:hypothetical protein